MNAPLEDTLVKNGLITKEQYNQAKEEAYRCKKSFWPALVKLGILSCEDLAVFFAQESRVPYVKISDYKINPSIIALIDEGFCRENAVIPLFKIQNALYVACGNPLDAALTGALAKITSCEIEPLISPADSITRALNRYFGPEEKAFEINRLIIGQPPLEGLPFWRESQRLALNTPVTISVENTDEVSLISMPIECFARDISRNGTALGLEILLFLPKGTKINIEFRPLQPEPPIKASGEIVYCRMEKNKSYFLGIKFSGMRYETRNRLFTLAKKQ